MNHPLSIFVLYSTSRKTQFEQFNRLLAGCIGVERCQKILVTDGAADVAPDGYDVREVHRSGNHYCWSDAWAAGVGAAVHDRILYLDCDRILPKRYLWFISESLTDFEIVYPRTLVNFTRPVSDDVFANQEDLLAEKVLTETITGDYHKLPCRGPMSGCSAFTKRTYAHLGPLDRTYQAWGYPDVEYQEVAKRNGCIFRPVDAVVHHLHHGRELPMPTFIRVNAWNGVRFFRKWKLPFTHHFNMQLDEIGLTADELMNMTLDELLERSR